MGASAHAMFACACTRSNRTDMRASVDAAMANARAAAGKRRDMGVCAHTMFARAGMGSDRTDMRARVDAAMVNARATAGNRADMGAGADTMFADMCANTHAKDIDAAPDILGPGGSDAQNNHAKNKGGGDFHGVLRHRGSGCRKTSVPGCNKFPMATPHAAGT